MLNLTRDTTGDVYLRMNGYTSLTNLAVVVEPTSINGSAASTHLTMKHLSQLEQHVEVLLRAHAITAGHNDRSTL